MIKTMNNNFYLYENNIRESGNNELVFGEPGQGQTRNYYNLQLNT